MRASSVNSNSSKNSNSLIKDSSSKLVVTTLLNEMFKMKEGLEDLISAINVEIYCLKRMLCNYAKI